MKNFVLGVMTWMIVGPVVREVIIKTTEKLQAANAARAESTE
jgi:hypothetical protein